MVSTIIAILTLALGVGVNATMFSAVNGILLEPLPYADASRLVKIESLTHYSNSPDSAAGVSLPTIHDIEEQCPAFEQFATFTAYTASRIQTELTPDVVSSPKVSGSFFSMLGVRPILGRVILPSDAQPGNERVAVLNYVLWKDDFGGDFHVVGRRIIIDKQPYTVIGVMPKDFILGTAARGVWTPALRQTNDMLDRDKRNSFVITRVKRGVSLKEASTQLNTLAARLAETYPEKEKGQKLVAKSVKDELIGAVRPGLLLLFAAVTAVLIVAFVNISGLLLTRGWARQKEIAIREALGATRLRIFQQCFAEGAILAFCGGSLGLLASLWGIHLLRRIAPPNTPRIDLLKLDGRVVAFTIGLSLFAAILFGLAPAIQISGLKITSKLRERLSASPAGLSLRHPQWPRSLLILVEVAFALILVVSATLFVRSFKNLLSVNLGYKTDHVLTMSVAFSDSVCDYGSPSLCKLALEDVLRRIRSLHGVESAAATSIRPLRGEMATRTLYIEGSQQDQDVAQGSIVHYRSISTEYFGVFAIPVLAGRSFADSDTQASERVVIVNSLFAKQYLSRNPIEKRIAMEKDESGKPLWMKIVGEVGDSRDVDLKSNAGPQFYVAIPQADYFGGSLVVRTSDNPAPLAAAIEQQIWTVDKNAPILNLQTMDQAVAEKVSEPRFQMVLLGTFATLALGLAMVGVYGLISFMVSQRIYESGVRMAVGAQPEEIRRMFLGEGMCLTLLGIGIGVCGALVLTRFLQSLLFEIKPADPLTFVCVGISFALVAAAACYIPARRAMSTDPAKLLRHD
jgi:predicted permease